MVRGDLTVFWKTLSLALSLPLAALAFDIGPKVGATVPALHVIDVAGKPATVHGLAGRKGIVLLFFRSAKWCPYCQKQLTDFEAAEAPLAARGYSLAAVSYDLPDVLSGFATKRGVTYHLLSDPGSVTIDAFNLRDPQYVAGSFAYGVPRPAIFVISPKRVLLAKLAEEGFKVRPTVQAVLDAVDGLPKP